MKKRKAYRVETDGDTVIEYAGGKKALKKKYRYIENVSIDRARWADPYALENRIPIRVQIQNGCKVCCENCEIPVDEDNAVIVQEAESETVYCRDCYDRLTGKYMDEPAPCGEESPLFEEESGLLKENSPRPQYEVIHYREIVTIRRVAKPDRRS